MTDKNKKLTSLRLDLELWQQLKHKAIEKNTTQSKLIHEYIKQGLINDK